MGTEFDTLTAGSAPLIARYCREINLVGIINDMVQWDPQQWTITPGDLAVTLIVNLLVDRHPLYRVMEFYENRDLDLLFGKDKVYLSGLNDIHYGRMLDRLFDANPKHVFQTVTASAIMTHKIKLDKVHADTTSQSVYGEYEDESDALNITFGFSKAKRPDLKQFIYGLMVAEGVPVMGNLRDGNTSDKECAALNKQTFACEPDARTALDLFMKEHASSYHYLNGTVASVEIPKPRKGRGRPPRSYVPETEVVWKITASVGDVKSDQVDDDLHQDELFILMTNELDDNKLPDADILKVYKDQMTVEKRFRWLKNPLVIKGIYMPKSLT